MKKIGVLFGVENSFPGALVERIQGRKLKGIVAEFVQVGAVALDDPDQYAVIVDRISHEVPFYCSYLKQATLQGAAVLNDPFRASVDDKFLHCALAARVGVAVPPTVLLPHKHHPGDLTAYSLRNLEYPLDWERVFSAVGEHGFIKPIDGGGGRDVYEVHSREEFFDAYDKTRDLCTIYQKAIDFTAYFRCYVVGQKKVRVMAYDPHRPHEERYLDTASAPELSKSLLKRIEQDAIKLSSALGYDLNSVEFAVADDVPYAIDFMNPVPDADINSVGAENHEWFVDAVADLAIARAKSPASASSWFAVPSASPEAVPAKSSKSTPKAKKVAPPKSIAAKKVSGKEK